MYKKNLTIQEAKDVIDLVSKILTNQKSPYSFYRLSELKEYNRADVLNAFLLAIALFSKKYGSSEWGQKKVKKMIVDFDLALDTIANFGIPDYEIDNMEDQEDIISLLDLANKWSLDRLNENCIEDSSTHKAQCVHFAESITLTGFADLCRILLESDVPNYWEIIYEALDLDYNASRIIDREKNMDDKSHSGSGCLFIIISLVLYTFFIIF